MKGIYQYTDLETGEIVYIGKDSHIDKNKRYKEHMQPSNYDKQHFNSVLQNSPDRHNYSVLYSSDDVSGDDLNMLEISFIERYNPKFNFTKGGDGAPIGNQYGKSNKGRKLTEDHKLKISEANKIKHNSKETKRKMSKLHKGKSLSEEHKQKISESLKGRTLSEETKQKQSMAKNTTSYYRVSKTKRKWAKQGFDWRYSYLGEKGKQKAIVSVDIEKLEEKVKSKGLKWLKFEEED